MLRRYAEVFRSLAMLADLVVVCAAWLGAVWLRFETDLLPPPPDDDPRYAASALLLLGIVPVWHVALRARRLYDARRMRSAMRETRRLLEVTALGIGAIAASTFVLKLDWLSRLVVALFAGLSAGGLIAWRSALRLALRALRRRGYNQRHLIIVGTGALAREVHDKLQRHPEFGLIVDGFLGPGRAGLAGPYPPHLGDYDALHSIVVARQIDQVIIALDRGDGADPIKMVEQLHDTTTAVRIVPDLMGLTTVQSGVEDLDGMPVIRLVESPLLGWNRVLKRGFDVVASAAGLLVGWPLLGLIAAGVKLTSPGPVFYRQERMSLDGELFEMIKFRSMREDAEDATGAVWAEEDDARRTPLGKALRRFNLDELPQLWNVLRGEMSLVGPRPERPEFIREFRTQMPGYMLRHKVRGGMTGWAQVNGCRGNTSIEERLRYDMEYLRRWSLAFDLKILGLTLLRGFNDPNAY